MTSDIVVYGATGLVGARACAELAAAGAVFATAGRGNDPALAFRGATVVLNCAPSAIAEPVLVAALAAGAHYVDLGGEQAVLHALYERHESTARKAGRVALLGAGVDCALGDWAAAWAAAHICELDDAAPTAARPARIAEDDPLDDLAVSYVFDDLVLSPAGQRAVFARMHARGLAWRRDRWEACAPAAERRAVNAGPAMGGVRDVASFPGGDVISLPRHVAARSVQTFTSTTRARAAQTALRWLARAMPFVPPKATELLTAYEPKPGEYARTQFAIVAQARRAFASAQVIVRGRDLYATSAQIAAWCARQLCARTGGPVGMRAASELFPPPAALRQIAAAADLTIEPSFG